MKNKRMPFVKWFIKKNNVPHQNNPRIVKATSKNDRAFLDKK